jgi:phosphohistidine phosphatase
MPRLILLRHAKSAWSTDASSDHERPLNTRGQQDAPVMGQRLRDLGWIPDVVFSSTATRTRQTWAGLGAVLAPEAPVTFLPELYLSGPRVALPLLAEQIAPTVMLIGHNPGFEALASLLSDTNITLTTCNAVLLTSASEGWEAAMREPWTLADLLRPREPRS